MEKLFGLDIVTEANIDNYNEGGVWSLFGKRKIASDNKWYCLKVASTRCIREEIKKDYILLENKKIDCAETVPYINYFGEMVFSYPEHPTTREYLYTRYIKELFEDFKFVVVCVENDINKRKEIERAIAINTRAIYWRNGRPYKTGDEISFDKRKDVQNNKEKSDFKLEDRKELHEFLSMFKKQQ